MPYTYRSKENLLREGIARERIFVIGNPINEVINHYRAGIDASDVFTRFGVAAGRYFLVTMHRAENVDIKDRLQNLVKSLDMIAEQFGLPIICSLHPRTKSKMQEFGLPFDGLRVKYLTPLGFMDFIALEQKALCVLTDSGTVQEECCILKVPNITIRDVTERPETIECGSNILAGSNPGSILSILDMIVKRKPSWQPPDEYLEKNVSDRVVNILFEYSQSFDDE
jgi:UDP-N-acetylglucosamine 2-epimerase (non-hydrolysing)